MKILIWNLHALVVTPLETKTCAQGNTHAYIQSQQDRYEIGKLIAEQALDAWGKSMYPPMPRRPCPRPTEIVLCALADFDGTSYGKEYLKFRKGDTIEKVLEPHGIDSEGWAYGKLGETIGWFPPAYAA